MNGFGGHRVTAPMFPDKAPESPPIDRKQEHAFRASAPAKDLPCCFPGCRQRFRKSTQYGHFLAHVEQHHRKKTT